MNYVVIYKKSGEVTSLFFNYRDETDIAYKHSTLITDVEDVISAMRTFFDIDNDVMVIKETLLDFDTFNEEKDSIMERLKVYLDEERNIL